MMIDLKIYMAPQPSAMQALSKNAFRLYATKHIVELGNPFHWSLTISDTAQSDADRSILESSCATMVIFQEANIENG